MSDWPDKWQDLPLAVLDVETTGLDAEEDRVTEVAIIRFEQGEVVETYGELVNPQMPIPEESTKITGISDDDVKDAPTFAEIADDVHQRLQDVGIVAYNLSFDRGFLKNELARCGLDWPDEAPTFDPLIFARQFFKDKRRKNLGAICELLGIELKEAHRATNDARVTGHVLYAFADRLPTGLDEVMMLQAQWKKIQAQEMASWRGGRQDDDGADALSDAFGGQTIGLGPAYIYGDETDPLRALYKSVPEASDG